MRFRISTVVSSGNQLIKVRLPIWQCGMAVILIVEDGSLISEYLSKVLKDSGYEL